MPGPVGARGLASTGSRSEARVIDLRDYDRMPPVGAAMTPFPSSVHSDAPVTEVEALMASHRIRHVPVQVEGRIVGIVSERDLHRLINPALPRVDKQRIRVRDVMQRDVYVVEIATPLATVLGEMAERRLGSAVVTRNGKLVGIFSTVDACRILARELEERFLGGDDAA
jgi:acetoin utilization protein AcuB